MYYIWHDTWICKICKSYSLLLSSDLWQHRNIPRFLSRVHPVEDDVSLPDWDPSSEEIMLMENVNIVFHIAATVKLNEPLNVAININTAGTALILQLCKKLHNLWTGSSTSFWNRCSIVFLQSNKDKNGDASVSPKFLCLRNPSHKDFSNLVILYNVVHFECSVAKKEAVKLFCCHKRRTMVIYNS